MTSEAKGRRSIALGAILLVGLLAGCTTARPSQRAVAGTIDLTTWSPERDGPVRLDGEWAFAWKPDYDPIIVELKSPERETLVLQASNFHYVKGGAWEPIWLGDPAGIRKLREGKVALTCFSSEASSSSVSTTCSSGRPSSSSPTQASTRPRGADGIAWPPPERS